MIYFTSDTHYGHTNILKYCNRPYSSIEEHDQDLIDRWNEVVQPKDEVYHLGDFAFSDYHRIVEILKQLKGKIHFIAGNHDKVINHNKDIQTKYFTSFQNYKEVKINTEKYGKKHVVLFHFPIESWHKSHYGSYHLHGHCHGSLKSDISKMRVDVGVDVWNYYPVSIEQIVEHMNSKKEE